MHTASDGGRGGRGAAEKAQIARKDDEVCSFSIASGAERTAKRRLSTLLIASILA